MATNIIEQDALIYFQKMLDDPTTIVTYGKTFVSNIEYVIYLIKEHRANTPKMPIN